MRCFSLWFGSVLGLSTMEMMVSNPGEMVLPRQLLMQGFLWSYGVNIYGDWASFKSQKRYMKRDIKFLVFVSLVPINRPSRFKRFLFPWMRIWMFVLLMVIRTMPKTTLFLLWKVFLQTSFVGVKQRLEVRSTQFFARTVSQRPPILFLSRGTRPC